MVLRPRLLFSFPHYQILAVAIILALIGVSEIVLAVVGFAQKIWGNEFGTGIWGGSVAFIAGISGLMAANTKAITMVRIFLLASALSCAVAVPVIVLSAGGLDLGSKFYKNVLHYSQVGYSSTKLVHGFLFALAVLQLALSVTTTVVCLKNLFWNNWQIKKKHSKRLREIQGEPRSSRQSRHRSSRTSTSSHAPLVSNNPRQSNNRKHRKHKHRRRPRSSENCSDSYNEGSNDERRLRQSRQRENESVAPVSNVSLTPDQCVSDASRIPEVSSNLMSLTSAPFEPHNTDNRSYSPLGAMANYDCVQHPIPIEDDEELPPYEESSTRQFEIDDESVFPMSLSENVSRKSSSISSEEEEEIHAWDSVSQTHAPTSPTNSNPNSCQETNVKFCPALSVQSGSSVFKSLVAGKKEDKESPQHASVKTQGVTNKIKSQSNPDPQGVSYHEFTRETDKIISNERKAHRSQSFQRERAMAKEGSLSASRKSSVQENIDKVDNITDVLSNSCTSPFDYQTVNNPYQKLQFLPQTYQSSPKPILPQTLPMVESVHVPVFDSNQSRSDSNESTSSMTKDIQFIKEGPPMQNVPFTEHSVPKTVLPFSDVSWNFPKVTTLPFDDKLNVPCVESVPDGIKSPVVKSEQVSSRLPAETSDKMSAFKDYNIKAESTNAKARHFVQPPRFSYPGKSEQTSRKKSEEHVGNFNSSAPGFTSNEPSDRQTGQSSEVHGSKPDIGNVFCVTSKSMSTDASNEQNSGGNYLTPLGVYNTDSASVSDLKDNAATWSKNLLSEQSPSSSNNISVISSGLPKNSKQINSGARSGRNISDTVTIDTSTGSAHEKSNESPMNMYLSDHDTNSSLNIRGAHSGTMLSRDNAPSTSNYPVPTSASSQNAHQNTNAQTSAPTKPMYSVLL